jgi:hypothetical protein
VPKSLNKADIAAVAGLLVVGLIALFGAWKVASRAPEPEDARALARVTRQVASLARETAVTANAILKNRVTQSYAKTHREKLEQEVADQAEKLEASFEPQLAGDAGEVRALTGKLSTTLKSLKRHLSDPEGLKEVADEAEALSIAVARLEPRP